MRVVAWFTLTLAMAGGAAAAQTPTASPGQDGWSLDISANTYIVPDSENYLQPTVAADHDWLHVEARVNYEDRDTGSIWLGYNFSFGEEVALAVVGLLASLALVLARRRFVGGLQSGFVPQAVVIEDGLRQAAHRLQRRVVVDFDDGFDALGG